MEKSNVIVDVGDRLLHLIELKGLNPKKFAEMIGTSNANIYNIVKKVNKPGLDLLEKIFRKFPEINKDWLIMGEGDVFLDMSLDEKKTDLSFGDKITKQLELFREQLAIKDEQITRKDEQLAIKDQHISSLLNLVTMGKDDVSNVAHAIWIDRELYPEQKEPKKQIC